MDNTQFLMIKLLKNLASPKAVFSKFHPNNKIQVDVCSFAKNFTECLNIGPGFLYDISKMRLCEVSKYNSVLADMSGHAVSVLKIECMDRHSVHLQN